MTEMDKWERTVAFTVSKIDEREFVIIDKEGNEVSRAASLADVGAVLAAMREDAATGSRSSVRKFPFRDMLRLIAVVIGLVSIPLLFMTGQVMSNLVEITSNLRSAVSVIAPGQNVNTDGRSGLLLTLNRLAQHAEELTNEREREMLRDLSTVTRRLQPFANTIRPLFTGQPATEAAVDLPAKSTDKASPN